MDETELSRQAICECQTRKILLILDKCKNLEEAIGKVEALLDQYDN